GSCISLVGGRRCNKSAARALLRRGWRGQAGRRPGASAAPSCGRRGACRILGRLRRRGRMMRQRRVDMISHRALACITLTAALLAVAAVATSNKIGQPQYMVVAVDEKGVAALIPDTQPRHGMVYIGVPHGRMAAQQT